MNERMRGKERRGKKKEKKGKVMNSTAESGGRKRERDVSSQGFLPCPLVGVT